MAWLIPNDVHVIIEIPAEEQDQVSILGEKLLAEFASELSAKHAKPRGDRFAVAVHEKCDKQHQAKLQHPLAGERPRLEKEFAGGFVELLHHRVEVRGRGGVDLRAWGEIRRVGDNQSTLADLAHTYHR